MTKPYRASDYQYEQLWINESFYGWLRTKDSEVEFNKCGSYGYEDPVPSLVDRDGWVVVRRKIIAAPMGTISFNS